MNTLSVKHAVPTSFLTALAWTLTREHIDYTCGTNFSTAGN